MRTYTTEQALEIAMRNAVKAIVAGYTAVQDTQNPVVWTVTTNRGKSYTVHLHINPIDRNDYRVFCDCGFSGSGFTNWTCKHGEICREILNAEYYRETDQLIRQTFRRMMQEASPNEGEDTPYSCSVEIARLRYPRLFSSSLRIQSDDNGDPVETAPAYYVQSLSKTMFGDPAIIKAYAADGDLWEAYLQA